MEVKFNKDTKMMESKYSSFNFPILSQLVSEELKSNIMLDLSYTFNDDETVYTFAPRNNQVHLTIMYDEHQVIFVMDQKSFMLELDHVTELYEESDSEEDDDDDDVNESDSEEDDDDDVNESDSEVEDEEDVVDVSESDSEVEDEEEY